MTTLLRGSMGEPLLWIPSLKDNKLYFYSFVTAEISGLLFQENGRSGHEGDPPPVPDHDDEYAGCEESLHGEPNLSKASVLMDALEKIKSISHVVFFSAVNGLQRQHTQSPLFDLKNAVEESLPRDECL